MTHDTTDEPADAPHAPQGGAAKAGAPGRGLDPTSRNSIENRLKSMYDEVASEPVPDRFLDLLNKLEHSEAPGGAGEEAH